MCCLELALGTSILKDQYKDQFDHCSSRILGSSLEGTGFAKEAVAYLLFSQAKVDPRVLMTSHLEVDTWAPCTVFRARSVMQEPSKDSLKHTGS